MCGSAITLHYLMIAVPPYTYLILIMQDSHLSTPFDVLTGQEMLWVSDGCLRHNEKVSIYGADAPYLFHSTTHISPPLPSTHAHMPTSMPTHLPHTMQHLPHTMQHLPHTMQHLPHTMQPLPHTLPHTPQHLPPTLPHLPHTMQHLPHTMQHLPHTMQHLPHTMQHLPHTM